MLTPLHDGPVGQNKPFPPQVSSAPGVYTEKQTWTQRGEGQSLGYVGDMGNPHTEDAIDPSFTPHTKVSSRWVGDSDVEPMSIQVTEDDMGNICLGLGDGSLDSSCKSNPQRQDKQTGQPQSKNLPQGNRKTTHRPGKVFANM